MTPGWDVWESIGGGGKELKQNAQGGMSHDVKSKPEVRTLKLAELKGWEKNPREIKPAARAGLRASIEEFGCVQPIVVNRIRGRWEIVSGHQRHRELVDLGVSTAPCVVVSLPAKRAAALALALNNRAIEGEFTDGVAEILADLKVELPDLSASLRLEGIELPGLKAPEKGETGEVVVTAELLEEHNYVVLYFDNSLDWQVAQEVLELKQVKTRDSRPGYMRKGVGRVIKGGPVVRRLTRV
jgi:hypothetical protein